MNETAPIPPVTPQKHCKTFCTGFGVGLALAAIAAVFFGVRTNALQDKSTQLFLILIFGLLAFAGAIYVLTDHAKYWMTEAIIITILPLVITAVMFLAVSCTGTDGFRDAFSVLTGVIGFIGGYAAAEKKSR
jgi:hypothetical protein